MLAPYEVRVRIGAWDDKWVWLLLLVALRYIELGTDVRYLPLCYEAQVEIQEARRDTSRSTRYDRG